jgi:membrane-bound inhibitor of C-type lysozyme
MLAAMSSMRPVPAASASRRAALVVVLTVAVATGCASKVSKEEEEAARNTFTCELKGERIVLRFDSGEARMLMPGGERVVLYQLPAASGVRFSNGTLELRGKGTDLVLMSDGSAAPLVDCQPYSIQKPS